MSLLYQPQISDPPGVLVSNALKVTPGIGLFYSLRVTKSNPVAITDFAVPGTFTTDAAHCLSVGDRVHIDLGCGGAVCYAGDLSTCLEVATVPSATQFTLQDQDGNAVAFQTVGTNFTNMWVAVAADLTGFRGEISLNLNQHRNDRLLGVAAIPANSNQIQILGSHDLLIGDTIVVGSYTGTVRAATKISIKGECYTIAHMDVANGTTAIAFTDGNVALLDATPVVLKGTSTQGTECGWVNANITGLETSKLSQYVEKGDDQSCDKLIGTWTLSLGWGFQDFPNHVENAQSVPQWSSTLAQGLLFV